MASKIQALISLLSLVLALSFAITPMQAGQIAVYWGTNLNEGNLTAACDSGDYEIVLLAFLNQFGSGKPLHLYLTGHCGDWNPCTNLAPEIKHCQSIGIKVFISLGGDTWEYSLASVEDAKEVATELYNNFFTGQNGLLGAVTLDGVDFDIKTGSVDYYDVLARELDTLRRENSYFYLSASPKCEIPDKYLDAAIKTGVFDYVWVQFYGDHLDGCQYAYNDTSPVLRSWNNWVSLVLPNNSLFLGLPTSEEAAHDGGFIPADVLIDEVLPVVDQTSNYGGVMLWNRYYDIQTDPTYSEQIKGAVTPKQPSQIAVYWGTNLNEGNLTAACDSGDYAIVLLAFLNQFGSGKPLHLYLTGHCGDWNPCTNLAPEIKHCQSIGIKVFISLGGDTWEYSLASVEDAKEVATELYNNFFTGQNGLLGAVTLDGVDFDIKTGSVDYYDVLARELDTLRRENSYFYLSASPKCEIPDKYLDAAIKTGVFDYVWVQFYGDHLDGCQYAYNDTSPVLRSWNNWISLVLPNNSLFLGLPTSEEAAHDGGFIPADVLIDEVLPVVNQTSNYGGVMLWNRYYDIQTDPTYSEQIKDAVLKFSASANAIFNSLSFKFYHLLPPYLRM